MIILGIDPGTGRTGWGVVKIFDTKNQISNIGFGIDNNRPEFEYIAHGCIVTSQEKTMQERLFDLYHQMQDIIKTINPDCMAIEHIFFGRNTKTAISVGQARGVIMLSAVKIPLFEYTGIAVKYLLSGHGRTEKKDIQKIVRRMLNKNSRKLSFNSKDKGFDDAADALAIAIHHALKISGVTREKTPTSRKKKSG